MLVITIMLMLMIMIMMVKMMMLMTMKMKMILLLIMIMIMKITMTMMMMMMMMMMGATNSCLESICSIPSVEKDATHLGLSNLSFLSVHRFGGHGWRKRNATIAGLQSLKSSKVFAGSEIILYKTSVHNPVVFSPFSLSLSPVRVRDYGPVKDTG